LKSAQLFARTNPIHTGSKDEIHSLIQNGVQVLMLPWFKTVDEVARFVSWIDGRAQVSLLIETAAAAVRVREIVKLPGIHEIHIGLNDLYLNIGLKNHFELLTSDLLELLSDVVRGANLPFGFGGIGRAGDKNLPIPPGLVYSQYVRLHADRALVSRMFYLPNYLDLDLTAEVRRFREEMNQWSTSAPSELADCRDRLRQVALEWDPKRPKESHSISSNP